MKPTNNKILVTVNPDQKTAFEVNGRLFSMATKWETNYREKSPVIAKVVEGNDVLDTDDVLLCHHNLFYLPSPYHVYGDLFSIPFSKILFAKIDKNGELDPICGNIICNRIPEKSFLPLPPTQQKFYINQYEVVNEGWTNYKIGDIVFTRPHSGYEIVYVFDGIENRVIKVSDDMVCGVAKK